MQGSLPEYFAVVATTLLKRWAKAINIHFLWRILQHKIYWNSRKQVIVSEIYAVEFNKIYRKHKRILKWFTGRCLGWNLWDRPGTSISHQDSSLQPQPALLASPAAPASVCITGAAALSSGIKTEYCNFRSYRYSILHLWLLLELWGDFGWHLAVDW